MIDKGVVYGSESQAKPLIIGADTVYVHTNITQVTADTEGNIAEGLYRYNEIQYTKDEFIMQQAADITEAQKGMCELYEMLLK